MHSVGSKCFKNLVSHFTPNGLSLRMHGNTKCLPANTIPFLVTEDVVQFIMLLPYMHFPYQGEFLGSSVMKRHYFFHPIRPSDMFTDSTV